MYHLAIDIGASSGRHILAWLEDGKIATQEIFRFENYLIDINGTKAWDIENLRTQVKNGLKECKKKGKIPETVAIDTWGVDYVLLDENECEIMPVVSYRDSRTLLAEKEVTKILPQDKLFATTGIQKQNFNTIYQLYCDKISGKLESAKHFLMMPEYLSYMLTGVIKNEYTNATTTNLVNAQTKEWDKEILDTLGIQSSIFKPLSLPTEVLGNFREEIREELGFDSTVIFCPSHDTASAVAAIPTDDKSVYISSGTWSLIGTENEQPILKAEALESNFTNEGGIEYRFRFLKNIMGMWLFQNIRKNLNSEYTYDQMMHMAMQSEYTKKIDPTHESFLAPDNMIEAVRNYLGEKDLPIADVLSSVYHSLAFSYDLAIREIENTSDKQIEAIHIVGGGSKDAYLNSLTAKYTGKKVFTGLTEATAIGNILSQIMYSNSITLSQARQIVKETFNISEVLI